VWLTGLRRGEGHNDNERIKRQVTAMRKRKREVKGVTM